MCDPFPATSAAEGRVKRFLVLFDLPSIHSFVFGTDHAREIRGGSGLVDDLNRRAIPGIPRRRQP